MEENLANMIGIGNAMRQSRLADEAASLARTKDTRDQDSHQAQMRQSDRMDQTGWEKHRADMGKMALEDQISRAEQAYLEAMRPLQLDSQDNVNRANKIKLDTARWDQQRKTSQKNYAAFEGAIATGDSNRALEIAMKHYNEDVFDGQTVKQAGAGLILVDEKTGKETPIPTDINQIRKAWQMHLADDPVQFYSARNNEELNRYNQNITSGMTAFRDINNWLVNDDGDVMMAMPVVDPKNGKSSLVFSTPDGKTTTSLDDVRKNGFVPMAAKAPLLQQEVFNLRQQHDATSDPTAKAAIAAQLSKKAQALEFAETIAGASDALNPKEVAQVEASLKSTWNGMDEGSKAEFASFEEFRESQRPGILNAIRAEKKRGLVSSAYGAVPPASKESPQSSKGLDWRQYVKKPQPTASPAATPSTNFTPQQAMEIVKQRVSAQAMSEEEAIGHLNRLANLPPETPVDQYTLSPQTTPSLRELTLAPSHANKPKAALQPSLRSISTISPAGR